MQQLRINASVSEPKAPALRLPSGSTPEFSPHPRLLTQGFWDNLRDFLTERSAKLPGNARQQVFRHDGLDCSFFGSFKAFFKAAPRILRADASGMMVNWQPGYRTFFRNLRDLIAPPKLPPLKVTSKPIAVRPLWAKDELFRPAQAISIGLHALLLVLILVPIAHHIAQTKLAAQSDFNVVDISPYFSKLPPGKDKAGGGGGGGERMPDPASRGKLPRWSMTQITPPMVAPRNLDPKLFAEPTLLGPPDLKVPSTDDANFGDPLVAMLTPSGGPGGGSGIGTGNGTGIGSGSGPGLGPGLDGGTGNGYFHPGTGGVGYPSCVYCPEPQYSEDARKAKDQGTVLLQVVIQPDGHAGDVEIVKGPGLGLEEKAVEAVRTWRFKPAVGPNGKPVATITPIEVNFRLL